MTVAARAVNLLCWSVRSCAPSQRQVVSALLIVGYLAASIGYPDFRSQIVKKGDRPFPCQFSACGCHTAEQCRQHCCCHSKQEKIAWALERGIDPNQVAVLTADEQALYAQAKSPARPAAVCQHCATKAACCSNKKSCDKPHDLASKQEEGRSAVRWTLAIQAKKCKGSSVEWIEAGVVALPQTNEAIAAPLAVARLVPQAAGIYHAPTLGILVPPG